MSWDLFVTDIPASATTVEQVPSDWVLPPIPAREKIIGAILEIVPSADASDPSWVRINAPTLDVEVNIGPESPLTMFALHIRGGDNAIGFVAELLDKLKLRAFDPGSDSGIFDPAGSAESLARWRTYRGQIQR
jgi:hypothetical protein